MDNMKVSTRLPLSFGSGVAMINGILACAVAEARNDAGSGGSASREITHGNADISQHTKEHLLGPEQASANIRDGRSYWAGPPGGL